MKTLIAYGTRYGATEKAAKRLAEFIGEDAQLFNLKKDDLKSLNLDDYEAVAIGGSIYAGNIQRRVKKFCEENMGALLEKRLGLFLCCGDVERADEQLVTVFEDELVDKVDAKGYFGYEYDFKKMNFLFKLVIKMMAKVNESKSEINEENIKSFAEEFISV
ncbi:flavodoxin domain-containing protein [Halonatronum saccharophilum]|uniref:flavodoxin domain-containing protein n=1 Tax=Halonatronum saccharophilum TaxID=150060 RepID=UPI00048002A2|nr:flavodoxin domain-containing protein [Halonatronum saccharophilum]